MSRPACTPSDAYGLLTDPKLVGFACDVTRNKAFAKADARTRDAYGKRVSDYVRSPAERDAWPSRITALLTLPAVDFQRAMNAEPVRLSPIDKPGGGKRIVGIPTFGRRCISNVITMILSRTGDAQLPASTRAYRPRSEEAVKHAILDVAHAVSVGRVRYFAKVDFTAYFAATPWASIKAALTHYGYADDFISVVMAVVRCPLVVRKNGQNVMVPNDRGAQMGLPESATLANMVPFELDEHFETLAGRLQYIRYSDDLFIGGFCKSDVVGAVRTVQRWCRKHGIAVKGTSPDTNPATLVHDVKNTRIELLGAEIDQNGEVRLPVAKMKEKLTEIRHRYANLETEKVIEGVSRYGNGGGTHLFDMVDVSETTEGFLRYWEALDPRSTRQARTLINKTFPMIPSPRSGGQGVAWIARLWGIQAGGGVEAKSPTAHDPSETTDAGLLALTGGRRASGPRRVRSTKRSAESVVAPGLEPTSEEEPGNAGILYTGAAADLHMQVEEEDSDEESRSYGTRDDDSQCDADGRETYSFSFTSKDRSEISIVNADLLQINGSVDDPREEPPLPVGFANRRVVHLAAERLGGSGGPRCVVGFGICVDGVLIGKSVVKIKTGRPESALVREMISMILRTSSEVVFAMSDARLVKTLLQPHRRFRSPLLYPLVSELHERSRAAGIDVTLIGGIAQPRGLGRAVHDAVRAESARSASGGLTPAMTSDHVL